jgi:predicted transcriptional regulator
VKEGIFTVRMDPEKQKQIDAIAKQADRSRNYIVNKAIDDFLDTHLWQVQQIEKGLGKARGGEFVSDPDMDKIFDRYKS